ncbi:9381_t:CDS:2 [Funneliformis mosseae]|uniref:9381_t:CDS:1 n=1 Tax=Funneliformis mosseae TaxID=27381 RepID=A0A9N9G5C6_FUNMO|nr:9381_t:CDS:2 [Funneliformis mosseae]
MQNAEYNLQQGYNYSHQREISDNNHQVYEATRGQHDTQNEYYQQPPYSQYQQGGISHSQQQLTYQQQVNTHQNQASIPHGYQGSPRQYNVSDPQVNTNSSHQQQSSPHQYASSSLPQQQIYSSRTASVPQQQEHTTISPEPNVYSISSFNGNVNSPDSGMNDNSIIGQRGDQNGPNNSSQGVPIIIDQEGDKGVQGSGDNLQQQGGNYETTRQIYYSSEPNTAYITNEAKEYVKSDGIGYERYPPDAYTAKKLETSGGDVGVTFNRYDSYNNNIQNTTGETQYNNNNASATSSQPIAEPLNINKASFSPSIISKNTLESQNSNNIPPLPPTSPPPSLGGIPNPNPIMLKDKSSRSTSINSINSWQKDSLQSASLPLTVTANPPPEVPSGSHPVTSLSNPQSYYNIPPSPLISPLPTQVANTQESVRGTNFKGTNSQTDSQQIPSQIVNTSAQMTPQTVTQIESPMNSSQISSSDYYKQLLPTHTSLGYSQSTPSQDYSKEESGAHEIVFPQDDVVARNEIVTSSPRQHHHGHVASVASSDGGFYNSRNSLTNNLDKNLPPSPPSMGHQTQPGSESSNYVVEARPYGRESRNHGSETTYGSEKNYGSETNYGNYGAEARQHGREMSNNYEDNQLPGGRRTNEIPIFTQVKSLEQIWGMPIFADSRPTWKFWYFIYCLILTVLFTYIILVRLRLID